MSGLVCNAHNGHDEVADAHGSGAPQKQGTTPKALNHVECGWGGSDVDDVHGGGHQEWVGYANLLEEGGPVVNLEVYYVSLRRVSMDL